MGNHKHKMTHQETDVHVIQDLSKWSRPIARDGTLVQTALCLKPATASSSPSAVQELDAHWTGGQPNRNNISLILPWDPSKQKGVLSSCNAVDLGDDRVEKGSDVKHSSHL
jgi:hypothetical protein